MLWNQISKGCNKGQASKLEFEMQSHNCAERKQEVRALCCQGVKSRVVQFPPICHGFCNKMAKLISLQTADLPSLL